MTRPILYIHGFASSGRSTKGRILKAHLPQVYAPSLNPIPELAVETLEEFITALGSPLLVGSSLGGYYALYLSARHGLPAVLVNPALYFDGELRRVIGFQNHYFDGSRFEFTEGHFRSLERYRVTDPPSERLLLLLQLGDEILDHRRTLALLPGAEADIEEGGDHGYRGFERKIEKIRSLADLR